MKTLFDKIFELDNLYDKNFSSFDLRRKELFEEYKNNSIFLDATKGIKTVSESFEELSNHTKSGIFIPMLRDKKHNNKVSEIEKLIEKRGNIRKNGLLYPDNILTGAIYAGVSTYFISNNLINYFVSGRINEYNAEFAEQIKIVMPFAFTIMSIIGGAMICSWDRGEKLGECLFQAKCIDDRIEKYYKNNF